MFIKAKIFDEFKLKISYVAAFMWHTMRMAKSFQIGNSMRKL